MTATLISGKEFAAGLRERVAAAAAHLTKTYDLVPGLAVVLVGEDPASQVYVRNKGKATIKAGMKSFEHKLDEKTSQADLLDLVETLNRDPAVHGILVQMPLPDHIDSNVILSAIDPAKDVDGLHPVSAGRLVQGLEGLVPCTPQGCLMLIKDQEKNLSGKHAVVIGRSVLVGKPVAQLLLAEHCTVTTAHSRTQDLPGICRQADILVAAVGRQEMVRGDWIKPGAIVIDVGINRIDLPDGKTKLVGDVCFNEAKEVASAITPVPGGVGPMTIACLLRNTVVAACQGHGHPVPEM